jgi:hypothetical protein
MSQAKRSRVRALTRWREQAARLVVRAQAVESGGVAFANAGEPGALRFDVAAVRVYCERLVAEGESLAHERVAFVAWTETRGLGPGERHPEPCGNGGGAIRCDRGTPTCPNLHAERGGWPLRLAAEWAASSGPAMLPRRRDAVLGDSIARTAKRLLDTLAGRCPWAPSALAQASECQNCAHVSLALGVSQSSRGLCRGTGHNLSGVLPAVEHPAPRVSDRQARASIAEVAGG